MTDKIVTPGECAVSIALQYQLDMDDLKASNEAVFATRTPNTCLVPGDRLDLPDTNGVLELNTNREYVIEISPLQYRMLITLVDGELKPIENVVVKCTHLETEDVLTATSDAQGQVNFLLPLSVAKGLILIVHNSHRIARPFYSGNLGPGEIEVGLKQRLRNLSEASTVALDDQMAASAYLQALANELNLSKEQIQETLIQST